MLMESYSKPAQIESAFSPTRPAIGPTHPSFLAIDRATRSYLGCKTLRPDLSAAGPLSFVRFLDQQSDLDWKIEKVCRLVWGYPP